MAEQDNVSKARDEYGITNADKMSDSQLKAEMKAIDDQVPQEESSKSSSTSTDTKPTSSKSSKSSK